MRCSSHNGFRRHPACLTEGKQGRLVVHQEIQHARKKGRFVDGVAHLRRLDAGQGQETAEHIRLVGEPAKYRDCRLLRVGGDRLRVLEVTLHFER